MCRCWKIEFARNWTIEANLERNNWIKSIGRTSGIEGCYTKNWLRKTCHCFTHLIHGSFLPFVVCSFFSCYCWKSKGISYFCWSKWMTPQTRLIPLEIYQWDRHTSTRPGIMTIWTVFSENVDEYAYVTKCRVIQLSVHFNPIAIRSHYSHKLWYENIWTAHYNFIISR